MTPGGPPPAPIASPAFVATACALMALVSLSIDAILPGLQDLATDLGVAQGNRRQWVITALFLGLAVGQLFYGPLSDTIGRRKAILLGVAVFSAGSVISAAAQSFEAMLLGRTIQGFGVAGPRTVTVAMIRDRLDGAAMARLMSLIMTVFIMVPVLAPGLGQLVLLVVDWRVLFLIVMAFAWAAALALVLLVPERRINRPPFSLQSTRTGAVAILAHRRSMAITAAGGCVYGGLMGYVNSSQQIFHGIFATGAMYPVYFGGLALFMGAATITNRWLLRRSSMQTICVVALALHCIWSAAALLAEFVVGGLGLWWFIGYSAVTLFALGLTFGNFNAMALQPFGHIAGAAAAVQATVQTVVSLVMAAIIGNLFDGTLVPVLLGYLLMGVFALALMRAPR
ncbi:MAG: MFS transporter [Paracoccaceae bacterium]|nr:MAG: MFS transporter [Paracoccaceae bacterium]